jgi:hypothetical protein
MTTIIRKISRADTYITTITMTKTATTTAMIIQSGMPKTCFFRKSSAFVTKDVETGTEAAVFPDVGFPKTELRDANTELPWK